MIAKNSTSSAVHIVVTCTNRKRVRVPEYLRLGSLREHRPGQRFATWVRRLSAAEPLIPARNLYSGEHWRIATNLPSLVGNSAQLWVCSAGYGLVRVDERLSPYAATFSTGTSDSVGSTSSELQQWWQRLADWPGPQGDEPRSFVELAKHDPQSSIVAVMSDAYLRACGRDLHQSAAHLSDPDRLAVIGPPRHGTELEELLVPVTARLRSVVGGSLHSLHVRAASHLLSQVARGTVSRGLLRDMVRSATETAPADTSRRDPGVRLSDEEVRDFITQGVAAGPTSATALLRKLRNSGRSCEQSRFKRLFEETIGQEEVA